MSVAETEAYFQAMAALRAERVRQVQQPPSVGYEGLPTDEVPPTRSRRLRWGRSRNEALSVRCVRRSPHALLCESAQGPVRETRESSGNDYGLFRRVGPYFCGAPEGGAPPMKEPEWREWVASRPEAEQFWLVSQLLRADLARLAWARYAVGLRQRLARTFDQHGKEEEPHA